MLEANFSSTNQQDVSEFLILFFDYIKKYFDEDALKKLDTIGVDHEYQIIQSDLDFSYSQKFRESLQCTICGLIHSCKGKNFTLILKFPEESRKIISLLDLIRHSTATEMKNIYCVNCKSNRDHTSTTKLIELPKVLIIQVGRYMNYYNETFANRTPVKLSEELDLNFLKM